MFQSFFFIYFIRPSAESLEALKSRVNATGAYQSMLESVESARQSAHRLRQARMRLGELGRWTSQLRLTQTQLNYLNIRVERRQTKCYRSNICWRICDIFLLRFYEKMWKV
jgi:hypothetical protein